MDATRTYKSALLTNKIDTKATRSNASSRGDSPLLIQHQSPTPGERSGYSMDMKLGLGAKAKLALTDSLDRLNSKFQLGTFPGVVQNQSLWSNSEMRVWMSVLFVGVACLCGNQVALPMTIIEVEKQLTWQRKDTVCCSVLTFIYLFIQRGSPYYSCLLHDPGLVEIPIRCLAIEH
jgi:hypothetical protein